MKLNESFSFDRYPMPRVDELLDWLSGTQYISTLDLTKGYWQVSLALAAKIHFSTPGGPCIHGGQLDDVIIHSRSLEVHLLHHHRLCKVLWELDYAHS